MVKWLLFWVVVTVNFRGFWLDTLGAEGSALASSKPAKKAYRQQYRFRVLVRVFNPIPSAHLDRCASFARVRHAQAARSDKRADRFSKEWRASVLGPSFLSFLGDYLYHGSRGPSRRGGALIETHISLSCPYYPF